jgi:hypothetical protein
MLDTSDIPVIKHGWEVPSKWSFEAGKIIELLLGVLSSHV